MVCMQSFQMFAIAKCDARNYWCIEVRSEFVAGGPPIVLHGMVIVVIYIWPGFWYRFLCAPFSFCMILCTPTFCMIPHQTTSSANFEGTWKTTANVLHVWAIPGFLSVSCGKKLQDLHGCAWVPWIVIFFQKSEGQPPFGSIKPCKKWR